MKKGFQTFVYAFNGILYALKTQRNMRFHALAAIVVIAAGFYFKIAKWEWCAALLCCMLVISLELLNTAIETLADKLHPERDKMIGIVKDVSAGAVFVASILAIIIGGIIFLPRIFELIG
jgi:diacylglycerol kinase